MSYDKIRYNKIYIIEYLKGFYGYDQFPRSFMVRTINGVDRSIVDNFYDFTRLYINYNGYANIYTGVHCIQSIKERTFDRIYIDLDTKTHKELIEVQKETDILANYFNQRFGLEVDIFKSGYKGNNLYPRFPLINISSYYDFIEYLFEDIQKDLKLKYLDLPAIKKVNGVSRVPYSIHLTSEILCEPIEHLDYKRSEDDWDDYIDQFNKEYEEKEEFILPDNILNRDYHNELEYIFSCLRKYKPRDGWRRSIWKLIAPRMVQTYNITEAKERMRTLLNDCGASQFNRYASYQLDYADRKSSIAMGLDTFCNHYPELARIYNMG